MCFFHSFSKKKIDNHFVIIGRESKIPTILYTFSWKKPFLYTCTNILKITIYGSSEIRLVPESCWNLNEQSSSKPITF